MTDKLAIAPFVDLREVEWRVDGKPSQNNTARFVPYVDATTTARLLDEWVGPGNWSDRYEPGEVAGKPALWCYLSVKVGDGWVTKRDVGVASNFEAQKGMVSDAFKRVACIKWGVARNVYSLPTLWAPCRVDQKGNAWPNDKTLPALHRELTKLGYEASGRLSAAADEDNQPSGGGEVSGAGTENEGQAESDRLVNDVTNEAEHTGSATRPAPASGKMSESAGDASPPTAAEPQSEEAQANPGSSSDSPTVFDPDERDSYWHLIDIALSAGQAKVGEVLRAASEPAKSLERKPPTKRDDLKEQPAEVLRAVCEALHLGQWAA